jgi:hypothetical protein
VGPAAKHLVTCLAPSPQLSQVAISIPAFSAQTITVAYQTLPANTPRTNANFVAVWESTMIPWTVAPLGTAKIPGDTQMGSVVIGNLSVQQKPYIVGYAVGPNITDICASSVIYVGGQNGPTMSCSIGISSITDDTIVVYYQCCNGYQPAKGKNWIGLWQGTVSPYYAPSPLASVTVTETADEGYVPMNNLGLTIQTPYTLIYFLGPNMTEAAAILNFTTGS